MNLPSRNEFAERFIRYTSVYTQSEEGHEETPSTPCQRDLARMLTKELQDMGASDVFFDEKNCYVYAGIPGNLPVDEKTQKILDAREDTKSKRRTDLAPIIGLIAHMDTSSAVYAKEIHPQLIPEYDGGRITLNSQYSMGPEDYPDLAHHKGEMLVTSDGTSVLGADDKAGVTQIMEAADYLLHHPEIAHCTVRIMFTPDEETGNGVKNADLQRLGCDYGYTVDGGAVGSLEYENFNAASAIVDINGRSTHPGDAKGRMINAQDVAMQFHGLLPAMEKPMYTEGYEGFYHLEAMNGTCDHARLEYILRDHDRDLFMRRKETVQKAADIINHCYGQKLVTVDVHDSYYNMAEKIRPHMHLINVAKEAITKAGLTPVTDPIRGGTDGCVLSFRGIPCPNLGTGGYNYHSRFEYASVDEIRRGTEILIRILNKYAEYTLD